MTLFFISIIIQNPLPFYHGCLFLEALNQISRLDFFGYLYRVYFQFFISFLKACYLEIIEQNKGSV